MLRRIHLYRPGAWLVSLGLLTPNRNPTPPRGFSRGEGRRRLLVNRNAILAIVAVIALGVLGYATLSTTSRISPDPAAAPEPTPSGEPARPVEPTAPGNSAVQ